MINDAENKIENLQFQECSLKSRSFSKVVISLETYVKQRKYCLLLQDCCIENLIFIENNVVWFWDSLDVQSTNSSVELYSILPYSREFLKTFCTSLWKRVHNLKEIVNLQEDLFVLTVGYVDIKTYIHYQSITILLKEYILFIGYIVY